MVFEDDVWAEPRPLGLFSDAPDAMAADMSVSPDGQRLYFTGRHPMDADRNRDDLNIWVSRREDGEWSVAEPLPAPNESYAIFAGRGEGGIGGSILLVSSVSAIEASPMEDFTYTAAKAALNAYAKKLAVVEGSHGIRAIALLPGSSVSGRRLGNDARGQPFDLRDGAPECAFGAARNAEGGGRCRSLAGLDAGRVGQRGLPRRGWRPVQGDPMNKEREKYD